MISSTREAEERAAAATAEAAEMNRKAGKAAMAAKEAASRVQAMTKKLQVRSLPHSFSIAMRTSGNGEVE